MAENQDQEKTFKLPDEGHWAIVRDLAAKIERTDRPKILSLAEAIEWIHKEKPIIWLGSIFSVPKPSKLPSGQALAESLFEIIFPGTIPEPQRHQLISTLMPKWPLELLFDEFDFWGIDISSSLLQYFNAKNYSASTNPLHQAVVQYYEKEFARKPLCITTNWDTLQEKAFHERGFTVIGAGPRNKPEDGFGEAVSNTKTIYIYHPHGSFATRDVVCSLKQEQRQLPNLPLNIELMSQSTLFLGYSGYEPSLYQKLESGTENQLWCIRDLEDFEIHVKRRLLCRPNVSVYVGDVRELLRNLGILDVDVDFTSIHVARENSDIPPIVIQNLQVALISSMDIEFCINELSATLLSLFSESETPTLVHVPMKALINHLRDRTLHTAILPALLAGTRIYDSEQLWITILAYLLRVVPNLNKQSVDRIMQYADEASKKSDEKASSLDEIVYTRAAKLNRSDIYKHYIGHKSKFDDEDAKALVDFRDMSFYAVGQASGDLGLSGEYMEMLAFLYLRDGNQELASNCFDIAATYFYLYGLWNAGLPN